MPTKKNLILIKKDVYGQELLYPGCDNSRVFCNLLNQKTLTRVQLAIIAELGYEIRIGGGEVEIIRC